MLEMMQLISASFTAPIRIGTNMHAILWLIPLSAAIAIVYKTTKLNEIKPIIFLKETILLFGSIIVFIAAAAIVLLVITHLVT